MQIRKADWPSMKNEVSYISCSSLVTYTEAEIRKEKVKDGGRLSNDCIDNLNQFADDSISLPSEDIDDICNALEGLT